MGGVPGVQPCVPARASRRALLLRIPHDASMRLARYYKTCCAVSSAEELVAAADALGLLVDDDVHAGRLARREGALDRGIDVARAW